MTELLLETATDVCSVAVARDGVVVAEATATEIHQHASHLTLLIRGALRDAGNSLQEMDRLVLSDGPGSYTSLRVGAATAKGLCLAVPHLQFSTVPTLAALAGECDATGNDRILATINSRRGEVFGQLFRSGDLHPESKVMNVRLADPQWRGKLLEGRGLGRIVVCGPGQQRIREATASDNAFSFAEPLRASARYLVRAEVRHLLAEPDVASYEPYYLNAPHVTRSKKKPLL
ncbi:tRNA threonylcarbamoyladenosine biosynthesis protein TsaB [Neolewinella xylanilytica]|uniref:tRNA threonylcarbamoyladenosine biosynthesis protein TsaB n=1 Tax=Neolewinella xylanilytica TaxID=1514080 RepID=A0A2S6I2Z6_9BACT|nr:tRNA (adenosine(37)-N6)-threonylcarbamoyltransferase complex dimerization subunit type 1 TsaB [Neolewinella xylanilytica]PPK85533.1 tRNA threonylcarbamoyladenosine biosynthesis protein TsaB [Neolewinella xylanilytica]